MASDEMRLAELAGLSERLEHTTSRLELAGLVAELLRRLQPEEIGPATRLLIGRVFPAWDSRALNLSWATIWQVIAGLAPADEATRRVLTADAVDAGQAVQALLAF